MMDVPAPVTAWSSGQLLGVVIALMVVGLLLIALEAFVIPGFGVAGVFGLLSLGGGTIIAWNQYGPTWGATLLFGSLLASVLFVWIFFKSRAGQRLVLNDSLENAVAVSDEGKHRIGLRGVAFTMLRPAGVAEFGDERVEVETEGDYVAKGRPVVVIDVQLGRVVVEEVAEGAAEADEAEADAADADAEEPDPDGAPETRE